VIFCAVSKIVKIHQEENGEEIIVHLPHMSMRSVKIELKALRERHCSCDFSKQPGASQNNECQPLLNVLKNGHKFKAGSLCLGWGVTFWQKNEEEELKQ